MQASKHAILHKWTHIHTQAHSCIQRYTHTCQYAHVYTCKYTNLSSWKLKNVCGKLCLVIVRICAKLHGQTSLASAIFGWHARMRQICMAGSYTSQHSWCSVSGDVTLTPKKGKQKNRDSGPLKAIQKESVDGMPVCDRCVSLTWRETASAKQKRTFVAAPQYYKFTYKRKSSA